MAANEFNTSWRANTFDDTIGTFETANLSLSPFPSFFFYMLSQAVFYDLLDSLSLSPSPSPSRSNHRQFIVLNTCAIV